MKKTHKLFVCGHTGDGKIIINNQNEIQDTPTPVDIPFQIKQICAGVAHLWGLGLGPNPFILLEFQVILMKTVVSIEYFVFLWFFVDYELQNEQSSERSEVRARSVSDARCP